MRDRLPRPADQPVHSCMRKLVIGLLMALASISVGHAQEAGITGLQLLADNAATASAAADLAPLASSPVTRFVQLAGAAPGLLRDDRGQRTEEPALHGVRRQRQPAGRRRRARAASTAIQPRTARSPPRTARRRRSSPASTRPRTSPCTTAFCTSARRTAISRYAYDPDGRRRRAPGGRARPAARRPQHAHRRLRP